MTENPIWESFKAESANVRDRLKELIREGNLRRIVVEHNGRTVAEFPLTAGVVGIVAAPVLAAVGALVALLKDCTIHVEVARNAMASTPTSTAVADTPAATPVDVEC